MRRTSLLAFCVLSLAATAQVRIDAPVELDGTTDADRQVEGLSDADANDEAVNARTLRDGAFRYAEVPGAGDWAVALTPAPTTLTAGTSLLVRCVNGNDGPVNITVNGLGPYALLKGAGTALVAGDVPSGSMTHMVFDGIAFQLIGGRRMAIRPCPPGSVAVNAQYCIEVAQHDTARFDSASIACGEVHGRLCTWGEWYAACAKAEELGLTGMIGDWEWTNSAANADTYVRVVGSGTCTQAGTGNGYEPPARAFRCCYRR
jgi:hypothetical protein